MKKLVCLLLVVALCISLGACGNSVPDGFTETTYNSGKEALRIMDKYLSGKIKADKAAEKLSAISEQLKAESEVLEQRAEAEDYEALSSNYWNGSVMLWISAFCAEMYSAGTTRCQTVRDNLENVLKAD